MSADVRTAIQIGTALVYLAIFIAFIRRTK